MSKATMDPEDQLSVYMSGWRAGAYGSAIGADAIHPDFIQGHADGRKAQGEAWRAAREAYGAGLPALREEQPR